MSEYMNVVKSATNYIREHALFADRIDWASVQSHLSMDSISGLSTNDAYQYINRLIKQLDDSHSNIVTSEALNARYWSHPKHPKFMECTTRFGVIGYVEVPGFVETSELPESKYIEAIRGGIFDLNKNQLIGWILDLRENFGGNMWPMLAALEGLLDGPTVGYSENRKKHRTTWSVNNGGSRIDSQIVSSSMYLCDAKLQSHLPLAFLTSAKTCSSGEAVVVSLKGRRRSRQFGTPTCGLSTGNKGYQLPCGATLWLTTAVFVDRNGVLYGGKIEPEISLNSDMPDQDIFENVGNWMKEIH